MPQYPSADDVKKNGKGDKPKIAARLQMADIARLAGVSVATVSRALSGSPLIKTATRERIAQLAQSLNYTVNLGAQNLRMQKNQTIAVVIPFDAGSRQHISDPFFLSILGAIADALTEHGYDMLLSRVDSEQLDAAGRLFDAGKAVGLIIIGQWRHHDQLNQLAARKVPFVVWGGQLPQQLYCTIGGDNTDGGKQATTHLLAQGRRRIAFLGDADLPEVWLRLAGYKLAHTAFGMAPELDLQVRVPFEEEAARQVIEHLCAKGPSFDGVIACSDLMAIQTVKALRTAGFKVPQDVSVVGYDDIPIAGYCDPPLTSIHQPIPAAGQALVGALLSMLAGADSPSCTLPVHLVQRESSRIQKSFA